MTRIYFDTRELYFLTQYLPLFRVLARRGVECSFVAYDNRPTMLERMRKAVAELELPVTWVGTKEDGLAHYQREQPDWILFGNNYGLWRELPDGTRTAMLYHGIGMKNDMYSPGFLRMNVRFIEGPYYERRVRALYPDAKLFAAGYAKLDPLFGPAAEVPRFDLEAAGLDPRRKTITYAPTHSPTSFPLMSDDWPAHFSDFNLIVKPHYLSFFGSQRTSHRRKMEIWSRAPNVHVAQLDEWDPLPFMGVSDLLISDVSAMTFEFAATGKPAVWCDFLKLHWTRRGPLRYRLWKRMDRNITREFGDVAAHARKYGELRSVVEAELEHPERLAAERKRCTAELIGTTDGRVSERIADYLLASGDGAPALLETDAQGSPMRASTP